MTWILIGLSHTGGTWTEHDREDWDAIHIEHRTAFGQAFWGAGEPGCTICVPSDVAREFARLLGKGGYSVVVLGENA